MKNGKMKRSSRWVSPVLTVLFVALVLTAPLAAGFTYADRSDNIDHTLTYERNKLTWDSATGIDAKTGVAQLDVFDATYENVKSQNGKNVIAPGTEGYNIVRLKNNDGGSIKFTAVLYNIESDDKLPVQVTMTTGEGPKDTDTYSLPKGVEKESVIKAVSGSLKRGETCDFDIRWLWKFETDGAQDALDTDFGTLAGQGKAAKTTVGVYIVVEEKSSSGGSFVEPEPPETGDSGYSGYVVLAVACAVCAAVVVLAPYKKRRKTNGN